MVKLHPHHSRHGRHDRASAKAETGLWHRPRLLNFISDLLVLCATAALGYAAVLWVMTRPIFPLEEVVLLNDPGKVTVDQLEYAARQGIHGNFFTVDLDQVKVAFERLPWVRSAQVRRHWPGGVELRLDEYEAAAYWKNAGSDEQHLVDPSGAIFNASSDASLPTLSGPPGSAAYLLAKYALFNKAVEPLGHRLEALTLSARQAWQLRLDDGMVLQLGRDQPKSTADARLERFVRAWPATAQQLNNIKVAVADLRYPGGFALRPEVAAKGKQ